MTSEPTTTGKVAFLGPEGTFTEEALLANTSGDERYPFPYPTIRDVVHALFERVGGRGGYICSLSDHFFETPPEKLACFADAARECVYSS